MRAAHVVELSIIFGMVEHHRLIQGGEVATARGRYDARRARQATCLRRGRPGHRRTVCGRAYAPVAAIDGAARRRHPRLATRHCACCFRPPSTGVVPPDRIGAPHILGRRAWLRSVVGAPSQHRATRQPAGGMPCSVGLIEEEPRMGWHTSQPGRHAPALQYRLHHLHQGLRSAARGCIAQVIQRGPRSI